MTTRGAMINRSTIGIALALFGSAIVSDQLVYRLFVVPRLDQWQAVPTWAWLVVASPMLLVGLAGGVSLGSRLQAVVAGLLATAATQTYDYFAAISHSPGYGKSWALEAPLLFWSVGTVLNALFLVGLLYVGVFARRVMAAVGSA